MIPTKEKTSEKIAKALEKVLGVVSNSRAFETKLGQCETEHVVSSTAG